MSSVAVLEAPSASPASANGRDALYEIVRGVYVEVAPMSGYAGWIASRLDQSMGPYTRQNKLGTTVTEVLLILDAEEDLRRRPDVAFVSADRWPLGQPLPEEGDWEVVPDLGVEVISPHDGFEAVIEKLLEYFAHGVRQVWLILPKAKQVHVYSSPSQVRILLEDAELDGGELIPGFKLPVRTLFYPD